MGCDYRIYKLLEITHTRGKAYIELDCERGYFLCSPSAGVDSDDERYEELYAKRYDYYLKSNFVPILIYEHGKFAQPRLEAKYKAMVERKVGVKKEPKVNEEKEEGSQTSEWSEEEEEDGDYDYYRDTGEKLTSMDDILTIYKIEVRELA
jgi:hypothetical protein